MLIMNAADLLANTLSPAEPLLVCISWSLQSSNNSISSYYQTPIHVRMPPKLLRMHHERTLCMWLMFTQFPHPTNCVFQPVYMQMMSAGLANGWSPLPHVQEVAGLALKSTLMAYVHQHPAISVPCKCWSPFFLLFRRVHGRATMQIDGWWLILLWGTGSSRNPLPL